VHGWCLMHNHGHWIFEASSEDSISNLMRDMQSRYSRHLNTKYKKKPWLLLGPLRGRRRRRNYSPYGRTGPVNWAPRFDAVFLDRAGFPSFLRYLEANPVEAGLVKRAVRWRWSSARAHCAGSTVDGLLCLDRWQHLFGRPEDAAAAWNEYLDAPQVEREANARRLRAMRTGSAQNRARKWVPAELTVTADSPPG
jgi:REP element-mobilizing transposase RayT